jgi:hypothetical protein
MVKEPTMPKERDVKKQIEALLDHRLDPSGGINLIEEIAISTISPGSRTTRRLGDPRNRCHVTEVLDVSGFGITGSDGTTQFRLSSVLCLTGIPLYGPINVLATPISDSPSFVTTRHSLLEGSGPDDVEIKFCSWGPNGAPAPSVAFNWRCRVGKPYPDFVVPGPQPCGG